MPPQRSPRSRDRRAPLAELPISHFLHIPDAITSSSSSSSLAAGLKNGTQIASGSGAGNGNATGLTVPMSDKIRPGSPLKPRPTRSITAPSPSTTSSSACTASNLSSSLETAHSHSSQSTQTHVRDIPSTPSSSSHNLPKTPRTDRTLRHRLLSQAGQEQAMLLGRSGGGVFASGSGTGMMSGSGGMGKGNEIPEGDGHDRARSITEPEQEQGLGTRSPARRLFLNEMMAEGSGSGFGSASGSGSGSGSRSSHLTPPSLSSPSSPATLSNAGIVRSPMRNTSINTDTTKTSTSTAKISSLPESRRLRLAPSPPIVGCFDTDMEMGMSVGARAIGGDGGPGYKQAPKHEKEHVMFSPSKSLGNGSTRDDQNQQEHEQTPDLTRRASPQTGFCGQGRPSSSQTGITRSNTSTSTRKVSARTHAERGSPTSTPRASKKSKISGAASPVGCRRSRSAIELGSPRSASREKGKGKDKMRTLGDVDMDLDMDLDLIGGRSSTIGAGMESVLDGNANADPEATGFDIWCDESGGMYASASGSSLAKDGSNSNVSRNENGSGTAYGHYLMSSSSEEDEYAGLWNAVASASTTRRQAQAQASTQAVNADHVANSLSRPGSSVAATASPSGSSIFLFDFDNQENQAPVGHIFDGAEKAYFTIKKGKKSSSGSASASVSATSSNPTSPSIRRPASAAASISTSTSTTSGSASPSSPSRLRTTPSRLFHARSMMNLNSTGGGYRGEGQIATPVATIRREDEDVLTPGRRSRVGVAEGRRLMGVEASEGI